MRGLLFLAECQPGASGGNNPDVVVRLKDAYSVRNTVQFTARSVIFRFRRV